MVKKFNIIEKKDIVINPESFFNRYLFKKDSKVKLAYPKEYFIMFESFDKQYVEIKRVLEYSYNGIFGFDVINDLKYIYDSCERYNKDQIKIISYDVKNILKEYDHYLGGLSKAIDEYVKDASPNLKNHKSDDDAEMAMRIVEAICKNVDVSINELIDLIELEELSYDPNYIITKQSLLESNGSNTVASNRSLRRKINSFYRQKNNNPESNLLSGYKFCVSGEIKKDDSLTLDLFEAIFNNDGQIFMPLYDDFIYQVNKAKMRLSEVG